MFGKECSCDQCDYVFSTGWSHHEGGQGLACCECGQLFEAVSDTHCMGPEPYETLRLVIRRWNEEADLHEEEDTGVLLRLGSLQDESPQPGYIYLVGKLLPHIHCPSCQSPGSLSEEFPAGLPCPSCHQGKIKVAGPLIY